MAFKRIATEGATTDGRNITRDWLNSVADTYDPEKKLGARVWLEHQRGLFADGPFPALGDVRAVRVKENVEGKLELYADIDPTNELVAMNKQRQKIYTSMELDHDFAGTGATYLTGLGVTDTPASLGTEALKFNAQHGRKTDFEQRKQKPANTFSACVAIDGDLQKDDAEFTPKNDNDSGQGAGDGNKTSLSEKIRAIFKRQDKQASDADAALRDDVETTLVEFAERHGALADQVKTLPSADEFAALKTKIDEVYAALDNIPDQPARKPATGGHGGAVQTDC